MDNNRFIGYYQTQAGNGLPGFSGAPVIYGRGIASIFSKLFRFVTPFIKRGVSIAKPHLKSAVKGFASDIVTSSLSNLTRSNTPEQQEGSGLTLISRRPLKRPPGQRLREFKKRRKTVKKRQSGKTVRRRGRKTDIF